MNKEDKALLEWCGWVVECENPWEIRHIDGAFATGFAAWIVLEACKDGWFDDDE